MVRRVLPRTKRLSPRRRSKPEGVMKRFCILLVLLVSAFTLPAHANMYRLKLTCDLDNAVSAGHYDWVHASFTKKKVPKAACKQGAKITLRFHSYQLKSGEFVTTDKVLKDMKSVDCRAATWPELLALGASKPEVQRHNTIVALGTLVPLVGAMGAPSLDGDRNERNLKLYDAGIGWMADDYGFPYVFAAICGGGNGK